MNEPADLRPPADAPAVLALWPGRALYLGRLPAHDLHAHHAVQVSFALEGAIEVHDGDRRTRHHAVAIAADHPHELRCPAVAQLYLDPEGAVRPAGLAGVTDLGERAALRARLRACWARGATGEDLAGAASTCAALVEPRPPVGAPAALDPRVAGAIAALRAAPGHRVALDDLASAVALSPSRLAHVFRAGTGLPPRRYALWLRLQDALSALARGLTLTEAAHDAGFADSAHLTRTFRTTFGMPPSAALLRGVRLVTPPAPPPAAPARPRRAPSARAGTPR